VRHPSLLLSAQNETRFFPFLSLSLGWSWNDRLAALECWSTGQGISPRRHECQLMCDTIVMARRVRWFDDDDWCSTLTTSSYHKYAWRQMIACSGELASWVLSMDTILCSSSCYQTLVVRRVETWRHLIAPSSSTATWGPPSSWIWVWVIQWFSRWRHTARGIVCFAVSLLSVTEYMKNKTL